MNSVTSNYSDIAIVGAGPAGIFTAYKLVEQSIKYGKQLKISIFEKGKNIYERKCPIRDNENRPCVHCNPCSIMHGFGGAGTFSDCKLSLTPYVGGDLYKYRSEEKISKYIKEVDSIFSYFDKDANKRKVSNNDSVYVNEIKEMAENYYIDFIDCPTKHLGTDGTLEVMKAMYEYLVNMKVDFHFNFDALVEVEDSIYKLYDTSCNDDIIYVSGNVVLAVGRSGNKWIKTFCKTNNIKISSKGADIGVRVETDAEVTDKITDVLYDMKFSYKSHITGLKARTFCTNPKGYVSEEHYGNYAVVNGHSFSDKKSERTNFAILVSTDYTSDQVMDMVRVANKYANGKILCNDILKFKASSFDRFIDTYYTTLFEKRTLKNVYTANSITKYLPIEVCMTISDFVERLNFIMPGLISEDTYVYAIEAKFYSDVVETNNDFKINNYNIYAIGDGAGKTRGIIQSAISGIIVAKDIFKRMNESH